MEMKRFLSPGLTLRSLVKAGSAFILTLLLTGVVSWPWAKTTEDTYRTIVAQLITGYSSTWEEEQTLQFREHLVFRISLYRANSEGSLLPHRIRSLANLEIHLQDTYPEQTRILYPVGRVEINEHELFVMFPRNDEFFVGLERIVLVATDQNDLSSTFRQIVNFGAANLFAQLRPAIPVGKLEEKRTIVPCLLPEGSSPTIEQLVQCHRRSVGSEQDLAEFKTRLSEGISIASGRIFKAKGHESGSIEGQSSLFSNDHSTTLKLEFDSHFYPFDGFSYDGKEVVGPTAIGHHFGYLAEFMMSCPDYVSADLVGGILSTTWPVLDLERSRQDFEFLGIEPTEGTEYLVLRCKFPSDAFVKLYFDPRSMQHLMTRYSGKTLFGSRLGPSRHITLTERFGEFRVFDGLYLPTRWQMTIGLPQDTIHLETKLTQVFHKNASLLKP